MSGTLVLLNGYPAHDLEWVALCVVRPAGACAVSVPVLKLTSAHSTAHGLNIVGYGHLAIEIACGQCPIGASGISWAGGLPLRNRPEGASFCVIPVRPRILD